MSDTGIEASTDADTDVNPDVEIKSMKQDRLGRKYYSRRIAKRICHAGDGPSVVFGLAGPWGSGKSSVLNMITEVLEKDHKDTWSVVSFTPWSAGDPYTLTSEFYSAIASAMPPGDAGNTAKRLLAAAAPASAAALKTAAKSFFNKHVGDDAANEILEAVTDAVAEQAGEYNPDTEPDPFAERFTKISEAIAKAGKNVLVIVDDVDRLHSDELLSVMKAVRLLGRFDRVHYLLSYDEETVIDVLVETDLARGKRRRASKYLEKIVQYPFVLPPIQLPHLATEFRDQLRAIAKTHDVAFSSNTDDEPDHQGEDVSDLVFALLPTDRLTLRSIYRLCNQVDIMLSLVGGGSELDLFDAALLTFIRLEYPTLYTMLPRWRKELVGSSKTWGKEPKITADQRLKEIAELVDLAPESLEAQLLYAVLVSLFPYTLPRPTGFYVRDRNAHCQVRDSTYFERYFSFGLPVHDIRDADVRAELTELAQTGTWPEESIMLECLPDEQRRRLLRGKVMQNLGVIAAAPSPQSSQAAHLLTREVPTDGRDLVFNRWSIVIYALLGHAISKAETKAAEQIVTDYYGEFGLATTTDILSRPIELPGIDTAKVVTATKEIRQEVLERSMLDLTTNIPPEKRLTHTVASFMNYLDDDLWAQLGERAQDLLASDEDVTLSGLGARFVHMVERVKDETGATEVWHHEFMQSEFAKLIPRERWSLDQLPELEKDTVDTNDTSLANRTTYAALALRDILNKQAPGNQ